MKKEFIEKSKRFAKKTQKKLVGWWQDFFTTVQRPYKETVQSIEDLEGQVEGTHKQSGSKGFSLNKRSFRSFWFIGLVMFAIGALFYQSLTLIYLIITAFIISMAVESVIRFFQSFRGISRGFAIGLSYFLLLLFLLSAVIIVIPFIVSQLIEIGTSMLDQLASWQNYLQQEGLEAVIMDTGLPVQVKEWLSSVIFAEGAGIGSAIQNALVTNVDQLVSFGTNSIKDAGGVVVSLLSGFFSIALQFTIVFVMAVFFSVEKKAVIHLIAKVSGQVERTELVLMKVYRKLGLWLKGQAVLSITIFAMVYLGLWLISVNFIGVDIPNKFTLALIAGMLESIPYLGPFLGMFPALLIAVSLYGLKGFITVIILYWIIQQSENNVLVPMVMSHTLGTSPLLIFICMTVGGTLFGFLGILLAVPISVIVSILYGTYSKSSNE